MEYLENKSRILLVFGVFYFLLLYKITYYVFSLPAVNLDFLIYLLHLCLAVVLLLKIKYISNKNLRILFSLIFIFVAIKNALFLFMVILGN